MQTLQWPLNEELKVEPHSCIFQSSPDTESFSCVGIIVELLDLQVQLPCLNEQKQFSWGFFPEILPFKGPLYVFPALFPFTSLADTRFGVTPHKHRGGRGWIRFSEEESSLLQLWAAQDRRDKELLEWVQQRMKNEGPGASPCLSWAGLAVKSLLEPIKLDSK